MGNDLQQPYQSCPLCDGPFTPHRTATCTGHALWHDPLPQTLIWVRCLDCGHSFTQCYWTKAGLAEVFSKSHGNQLAGGDPDAKRQAWVPVVETAVDLMGGDQTLNSMDNRTWLDVGFGDGALLMLANEIGFHELGLDARSDAVNALNMLGYRAVVGEFEEFENSDLISVISMMDVLEHIPFPTTALKKVRRLISPNGLLIISLPGLNSSSWRVMDRAGQNPYWGELEHFHNFSLTRLRALLNQTGFVIKKVKFPYRYRAQIELYCSLSD